MTRSLQVLHPKGFAKAEAYQQKPVGFMKPPMRFLGHFYLLALLLGEACGIEHRVSITQGVYGQTFYSGQSWSCRPESATLTATGVTGTFTVKADLEGFYQLALPDGSYQLCGDYNRCTTLEISSNRVRQDYVFKDPGGGWFQSMPFSCS